MEIMILFIELMERGVQDQRSAAGGSGWFYKIFVGDENTP